MKQVWKVPKWSNAIERDRARAYHQTYSALVGLYCLEKALDEVHAGRTKTWSPFKVPNEAVSCGFHEAARGVLSHHMVIEGGKVANYQMFPPTPWNASPRDSFGTPGLMKIQFRIHRSSRKMVLKISKALILCGQFAASILACLAEYICIWVEESWLNQLIRQRHWHHLIVVNNEYVTGRVFSREMLH